jgi:hypothetical protein
MLKWLCILLAEFTSATTGSLISLPLEANNDISFEVEANNDLRNGCSVI